ncbi:MAG: hypothetical protein AAF399_21010, partial [Bacteroidota bacterium]
DEFIAFAKTKGVEYDADGYDRSRRRIDPLMKSYIGRRLIGDDAFYPVFHQMDHVLQEAVRLLPVATDLERDGTFTLNE